MAGAAARAPAPKAAERARAVARAPAPPGRVRLGPVDDPAERAADQAAARVLAGGAARVGCPACAALRGRLLLQRKCAACEEEDRMLRRRAEGGGAAGGEGAVAAATQAVATGGAPLPAAVRAPSRSAATSASRAAPSMRRARPGGGCSRNLGRAGARYSEASEYDKPLVAGEELTQLTAGALGSLLGEILGEVVLCVGTGPAFALCTLVVGAVGGYAGASLAEGPGHELGRTLQTAAELQREGRLLPAVMDAATQTFGTPEQKRLWADWKKIEQPQRERGLFEWEFDWP